MLAWCISLLCRVHHEKHWAGRSTGIKIAGRNINNLRYADDTTLMAESGEELKSLLMKVKGESQKVGLDLSLGFLFVACQTPLSMEFSRQEYWAGLLFPTPGHLPNPGIKLMSLTSPALADGFFTTAPPEKPHR